MGASREKLAYAAAFTFILPAGLAAWAWATPLGRGLPLPPSTLGPPLAFAGGALWTWAVVVFWARTGKLPLNVDPPGSAVSGGPYALLDDPIYVGFVLAVLGAAVWARNAAGVWIVTPTAAAAAAALVAGYEGRSRPLRPRRPRVAWPAPSRPRLRGAATGGLAALPIGALLLAGRPLAEPRSLTILASLAVFAAVASQLHLAAVRLATRVANSWTAMRVGPLRIISYAAYAALAGAGGAIIFELMAPGPSAAMAALVATAIVLGGGAWGKLLESTGRLARPFGYFGAFLGGALGVVAASLIWRVPVVALGASADTAPMRGVSVDNVRR